MQKKQMSNFVQFTDVYKHVKMYTTSRVVCRVVAIEKSNFRCLADACAAFNKKGVVLGAYDGENPGEVELTPIGTKFDQEMGGNLRELIKGSGIKKGVARVFCNVCKDFQAVAVAGLGPQGVGFNLMENLDMCKENIRVAAGSGVVSLDDQGLGVIFVEAFCDAEAAAEGALLGAWKYQEFKNKEKQAILAKVDLFGSDDRQEWDRGIVKGDAQNVARKLEETPGNIMTPSVFTQVILDQLCPCGVQVEARDRDWLEAKKMHGFLTVAKGSCEQPLFLHLSYCGATPDDKPIILVGKGITFDTGGLCLKPCANMSEYRADMAGAAVIVGVMKAVATMALPCNVTGLIPLCENMPGGMAMKPGDIVTAVNGKSIRIENTDNEGRILLADILSFGATLDPCLTINIATLTNGMRKALGGGSSGVFTTSDVVWRQLNKAGAYTGDRVWRFPLWKYFTRKITDYVGVDVSNVGKGLGGASCLGAAFLMEFAPCADFVHLDITGTGMKSTGIGFPYLRKDLMTGRPTRTLVEFIYQIACPHDKPESVC